MIRKSMSRQNCYYSEADRALLGVEKLSRCGLCGNLSLPEISARRRMRGFLWRTMRKAFIRVRSELRRSKVALNNSYYYGFAPIISLKGWCMAQGRISGICLSRRRSFYGFVLQLALFPYLPRWKNGSVWRTGRMPTISACSIYLRIPAAGLGDGAGTFGV